MNRARVPLIGQVASLAIALVFGLGWTVQAGAQWLPDRNYAEGPGIRVGELELHPGIAVRGGYDNNVFRADGKTRNGVKNERQGSAVLAVTPHLYLSTEGVQRATQGEDRLASAPRYIGFRGGVAASYLHYFVENGPRNVAIDTDFFLGIAQGRPVELNLTASYMRSVAPFTQNAGSRNAYVYDSVDPALRLKFNSRSRVLSGYVGYAPRYTHYESTTFNYLNNIQHGVEAGTAWKFLPSTALVYDARFAMQDYTNHAAANDLLLLYSNNETFRTRLGLNGALTNSLQLRALAGYAVGFYDNNELDEFEDVIGEAVLSYSFGPHGVELGYTRDVQTSPLGAWYRTDRGFGNVKFLFARVFRLAFEAGVAGADYGSLLRILPNGDVVGMGVNGDKTREDIRIDGAIRTEYRVTDWLSFMADAVVQSVITDFEYEYTGSGDAMMPMIPDPADYTSVMVFGGVRAHY